MNAFYDRFNPLAAMGQGMNLWHGMENSYDAQMARGQQQREREALSQMGQGGQLIGFEDDPMAVRPDWLQQVYQSGNPELALKAEALAAQPYAANRAMKQAEQMIGVEALKQGELEKAKLGARAAAWKDLMPAMMGEQGGPLNAFAQPASMGMTTDQGVMPPGGPTAAATMETGGLGRALTGQGLHGLSGGTREVEFDLNRGPVVKYKPSSPLDDEVKRRDSILKGRETELNARKTEEQILQNERQAKQEAHARVFELTQAKKELKKEFDAGAISPQAYREDLSALDAELQQAKAHRASLMGEQPAQAAPGTQPAPAQQSPVPRGTAPTSQPASQVGQGLPYKMQQEMRGKVAQKKFDIAQDAIESAHSDAAKYAQHHGTLQNLMNLVATKEVGNRMGNIPGGETFLRTVSEDNDNLQKWRNEMIDVLKKEGASQLMNTLPELAIVSDQFPSVTNSPGTNRKAMANVMNLYEATVAAPKFLEDWAAKNGGTLDGARGVFREWMTHNKKYTTEERNGKVEMYDNQVIPLENWATLRKKFPASEIMKKWKDMNR